jgi:predicted amidohydrolase YtcJ
MRASLCLATLLLTASAAAADATIAVINARVWTGDAARPWAEALAASGERILAVGSSAEIRPLTGPSTRIVDGRGAMLTPGFIDSHIHLFVFDRFTPFPPIFLRFVRNRQDVADRIAAYAAKLPKGAWILGDGWTDALWGDQLPSLAWLDALAPGHPVWLLNIDKDIGIANSAALRAAGVTGNTTGVIRGGPMWQIDSALIEPRRNRDNRVVEAALARLVRTGVTSVHHNNGWPEFLILRRLHDAGRLPLRVYASPELPGWQRLRDYIAAYGRGDSWLHWGAVKGYGVITAEAYYPWVAGASHAGLQIMVHVGGNDQLRTLLSVFERVRREQHLTDPRFRVEHAHDMPPDAIPGMAQLGTIASWQPPLLAHEDRRTAAGQPPPTNLFPCRALLNAGVKIAFGTDSSPWTSDVIPPLQSLQMALERTAPDGTRITLDEALRAFTVDAAYAEFAEHEKGSLESGKLADFVLFDRDFSRDPVHAIHMANVRMTVIAGRPAWEN